MGVRLRQAVLVASELDPVAEQLRSELNLGEPFEDPGVGEFGLRNHVYALGDQFIEIVSPTREGTAAGRHLERHGGDGGYMVIFQLDDLEAARRRVTDLGVRVVWQIDLPDISGTHLHPSDMRGAIVSLDRPIPPESWRWGGPDWEGRAAPGRLAGVTMSVRDPEAVADRWDRVLAARPDGLTFKQDSLEGGLTDIAVAVPGRGGETKIGGVTFRFVDEENQ
jgi:predicted enzyme related to lactoylglutathione lyase